MFNVSVRKTFRRVATPTSRPERHYNGLDPFLTGRGSMEDTPLLGGHHYPPEETFASSLLRRLGTCLTLPRWSHGPAVRRWTWKFLYAVRFQTLLIWRSSPNTFLLVYTPIGIAAGWQQWKPGWVAFLNAMSLIPIIDLHVIAAEEFAAECFTRSKAVGGLFFAIAGSSARPILRVLALLRGETKIARTSGLGTILLSLLLTPGLAFLFGFYANPRDQYGRSTELQFLSEAAEVTISQLVPATFLLLAPSLLQFSRQADTARDPKLDIFVHAVSPIALLALFGLVLNFQLRTHSHMFSTGDEHEMLCEAGAAEDEVDDIPDRLTPLSAATTLVITTFLITVCGDFMVASLGENQATETVAGTVILPIVTGGADILRSVMAAVRGNTTLAILFSLSSALQVSVLDTPLLGIASFITKKSNPFELVFTIEEAAAITMTLIASLSILQRGKSNYIDGLMLTCLYVFMVLMLCYT